MVTMKCERCSVYLMAHRRGRGEPEANNNQNNELWSQCNDFNLLTGNFVRAGFNARYGQDESLGIGALGVMGLREAVLGIWFGNNVDKCFRTIAVHISEPVRYRCIADHFRRVVRVNLYGVVELTDMMRCFIKKLGCYICCDT
ncbi:hypothetical protein RND81_06G206400 [Saponaria officinalis]|uniref:rRNA N-glycosylase n=1 Tax=Saponaria officinalis TaxID=3572 RepID=A0AAW1KDK2_SAPOF